MSQNNWKLLIVDDEESVHAVTKLALADFEYDGRGLDYFHAYSGVEARERLKEIPDVAVILLDVVMETDDAGLQLCDYIRKELKNSKVRILLRTGQAGQVPAQQVIMDYEINDYIEKTELTMGRLINHMVVALRAFRDMGALKRTRTGYEMVVDAADKMNHGEVPKEFLQGALIQLAGLLYLEKVDPDHPHTFALATEHDHAIRVVAVVSDQDEGEPPQVSEDHVDLLRHAAESGENISNTECYINCYKPDDDETYLLYISTHGRKLSENDEELVALFCRKLARFMDNTDS